MLIRPHPPSPKALNNQVYKYTCKKIFQQTRCMIVPQSCERLSKCAPPPLLKPELRYTARLHLCIPSLTGNGLIHHLRERCEDISDSATLALQVKLVHSLLLHQVILVSCHGNGSQVAVSTTNKNEYHYLLQTD